MKCEEIQLLLVDSLMGELSAADREVVDRHIGGCPACAAEAVAMESTWRDLGETDRLRERSDSERMMHRFQQSIRNFEGEPATGHRPSFVAWWTGLWTARPMWQAGFSAAVLACGVFLGVSISSRPATRGEIEALRADLNSMNQAVSVLLQHESASERLRAVSRSTTDEPSDVVLDALLQSARLDPNVNVRLAAVDALADYADRRPIRSSLIDSLAVERSPLMQLAVLEAVAGDSGFRAGELERILQSSNLDPSVLEHFAVQVENL